MIEIPGRLAYDATQVGRGPLQACPLGCGHHDLRGEERGWLVRSAGRRSSPWLLPTEVAASGRIDAPFGDRCATPRGAGRSSAHPPSLLLITGQV
jgi:hypothetical protein